MMTLPEAVEEIRRVGSLTVESGKLKLRFLEAERSRLAPALAVLRANRDAVIEQVSEPARAEPTQPSKLADLDPEARGLLYAQWRAAQLNELFRLHGQTGQPAQITAATVADGLLKLSREKRTLE
jgi:hypothetical protein